MSGTFLDDALLQITLNAYKAAGHVTEATLSDQRRHRHQNDKYRREPTQQALADLQALANAAIPALEALPPLDDGSTARHIIDALGSLPAPRRQSTPLTPRPEITTLTRSMAIASDMVTSARYRADFTAEHAATTHSRMAIAVGAVSRVAAASVSRSADTPDRDRALTAIDALTRACRPDQNTPQGPVPGLAPTPGTLPAAIADWTAATQRALQPRQVDARLMHTVPGDLQYLHAATTLVLGASTLSDEAPRFEIKGAADSLADAQDAWSHAARAWPPQMGTQPAGRSDYEQLAATQRLHESIRQHLRSGSTWAAPADIATRLDAPSTLRAIADLSPQIATTARKYAEATRALIEGGQIATPARAITERGEQGLHLFAEVSRGAWVPLPESDPVAKRIVLSADTAGLASTDAEMRLRHTRTGDFRDFSATPPSVENRRSTRRGEEPRRAVTEQQPSPTPRM